MKTLHPPSQWNPAVLVALLSTALLSTAYGQTNLFDDFEAGFSAKGWTAASGGMTIATGTNRVPAAGNQSAKMTISGDLEAITLPTAVSTFPWKFTCWLYDAGDSTTSRAFGTVRNYAGGSYGSGSLNQIFALGKYNGVDTGTYDRTKYQARIALPSVTAGGIGWFNLDDPGAATRKQGWHKFELLAGTNATGIVVLRYYVDGILSKAMTNTLAQWAYRPNSATVGSVGSGTTADTAYFDGPQVVQGVPFIISPPQADPIMQGTTLNLSVLATGTPPLYYQWRRSGTNIANATGTSFTIQNANPSDSTTYTVIVSNTLDVTSADVPVQVTPLIQVTIPPTNQTVNLGASATFYAEATGNGTLSYSWRHNGTPIAGATASGYAPFDFSYNIPSLSLSDAGTYTVTVSNDVGDPPTTVSAVLFVNTPPVVPQPVDTNAALGQAFSMVVPATDDFSSQAAPFQAFETNDVGALVTFANPYVSGTTAAYVDTTGRTYVTNVFPAGHASSHVLYSHFSFTNANYFNWLRLTTTDASSSGVLAANPIISFTTPLRFDMYTDQPLAIGLGLRETEATGPIGANSGTSTAAIEWAGVNSPAAPITGTNVVPAGAWTTVVFTLPDVAVTSFNLGNGALDLATGKGTLEHLCITDGTTPGQTGDYHIWLDNLVCLPTNALSFSLDASPSGAVIDSATGIITWTPTALGPQLFTVRVTDNMGLSSTTSFHVNATTPQPPVLTIRLNGNNVVLNWNDAGYALQAAPKVTGTFTNVPGAAPGYTTAAGNGALYFRLTK